MIEETSIKTDFSESVDDKPPEPKTPARKNLKKYIFSIVFMAVLLAITYSVIFKDYSVEDLKSAMRGANILWVFAGFAAI